jgi:hypothetical protein
MAGPVTNLRSLDSANFKTSKRADSVNDVLKAKLGLQHRYEPARLAIAHSLAMPDPPPQLTDDDADDSGKVIMGKTLFGDDESPVWVSVFLISQSPDDYDTVEDNFLDQIGLTVCFRSNGTSPRVLKACLGQTVDLAGLPDGVAVSRLPGQASVSRIKAWE